jgi:hypothetical protein
MNRHDRRKQASQERSQWVRLSDRKKIPELIRECYALHYILRTLDFAADEIRVMAADVLNWKPPGLSLMVKLNSQGKEFIYVLSAVTPEVAHEFGEKWFEFGERKDSMTQQELDRMVHGSLLWRSKTQLLFKLAQKGFELPSGEKASWNVN